MTAVATAPPENAALQLTRWRKKRASSTPIMLRAATLFSPSVATEDLPKSGLAERAGTKTSYSFAPFPARLGGDMRSLILWLIGVPIPLIIILGLITGHA